jgi:hypothetical protein
MAIQSKADILALLHEHRATLRRYGVARCGLFGSFVRDEQRPDSDVDLLVEFQPRQKSFGNLMGLADFLEDMLGRRIEIVTRESLSPHIGPHILSETLYAAVDA